MGDEVFADEELPAAFAGLRSNTNVLFVDEFGVWMTGLAPVRDARGEIVAVVAADMPPPDAGRARWRACAATSRRPSPAC